MSIPSHVLVIVSACNASLSARAHEHVSRKRVVRLMQADGLQARRRKRYKLTTMSDHDQPVAANLLDRRFEAGAPNQRWVGDTTLRGRRSDLRRLSPFL